IYNYCVVHNPVTARVIRPDNCPSSTCSNQRAAAGKSRTRQCTWDTFIEPPPNMNSNVELSTAVITRACSISGWPSAAARRTRYTTEPGWREHVHVSGLRSRDQPGNGDLPAVRSRLGAARRDGSGSGAGEKAQPAPAAADLGGGDCGHRGGIVRVR